MLLHPNMPNFVVLLGQMPDDFICRRGGGGGGVLAGTQWVIWKTVKRYFETHIIFIS